MNFLSLIEDRKVGMRFKIIKIFFNQKLITAIHQLPTYFNELRAMTLIIILAFPIPSNGLVQMEFHVRFRERRI